MSPFLAPILAMHDRIRDAVVDACERQSAAEMSAVAHDDAGDTIYAVDRVSEETLVACLADVAKVQPLVLIAEELPPEGLVLGAAADSDCQWRVLVDPIDGTRGLMYQKRPAWILTGVAPNRGPETTLRDITLAVQTEIPLVKQHLCDQLWAVRGHGAEAQRINRLTGERRPLKLRPSGDANIAHGFASISRFFPGGRDVLASIDDEIAVAVSGPLVDGKALCFEDQYISTGGQLYELMVGHDRFIADIRPLLGPLLSERGLQHPLCCHPYDLSALLIAEELGLIVTDERGIALNARMDLESDVSWVGYANDALRARLEPVFRAALTRRGLLAE